MPCDEVERQRRLITGGELGPVHRDDEIAARADRLLDPEREQSPDADALVSQETIDLLDRMLGRLAAGLRQRLTDDGDRERDARHPAEHRMRQRTDPLGVQALAEQGGEVVLNEFKPLRSRPHGAAIFEIGSLTNHVAKPRGKIGKRSKSGNS